LGNERNGFVNTIQFGAVMEKVQGEAKEVVALHITSLPNQGVSDFLG
jgi:hypothetical protein